MKTMKYWIAAISVGVAGALLGGCGTGVDPVATAVGNGTIPQLGPIISTQTGTTLTAGFSAATPYWTFAFSGFNGTYNAPADGVITQVALTTIGGQTTNYVTIVHTGGRLASRFYGVQNVVVRIGDSVLTNAPIGTYSSFTFTGVQFQVLLDGNPVCPLSFMSTAFRQSFTAWMTASNLCL